MHSQYKKLLVNQAKFSTLVFFNLKLDLCTKSRGWVSSGSEGRGIAIWILLEQSKKMGIIDFSCRS